LIVCKEDARGYLAWGVSKKKISGRGQKSHVWWWWCEKMAQILKKAG